MWAPLPIYLLSKVLVDSDQNTVLFEGSLYYLIIGRPFCSPSNTKDIVPQRHQPIRYARASTLVHDEPHLNQFGNKWNKSAAFHRVACKEQASIYVVFSEICILGENLIFRGSMRQ